MPSNLYCFTLKYGLKNNAPAVMATNIKTHVHRKTGAIIESAVAIEKAITNTNPIT